MWYHLHFYYMLRTLHSISFEINRTGRLTCCLMQLSDNNNNKIFRQCCDEQDIPLISCLSVHGITKRSALGIVQMCFGRIKISQTNLSGLLHSATLDKAYFESAFWKNVAKKFFLFYFLDIFDRFTAKLSSNLE